MLTPPGQLPIYLIVDALDEPPNIPGIPSSREKVLQLVIELVELHLLKNDQDWRKEDIDVSWAMLYTQTRNRS